MRTFNHGLPPETAVKNGIGAPTPVIHTPIGPRLMMVAVTTSTELPDGMIQLGTCVPGSLAASEPFDVKREFVLISAGFVSMG